MTERPAAPFAIHVDIAAPGDWPATPADLRRTLIAALGEALREAPPPGPREVEVTLADAETLRALNRRWRGRDAPTNVLSFPASADMPVPPGRPRPLGDIILAGSVVADQAARAGVPLGEQLAWLAVHGLLHLLGYDHETPAEARVMEDAERRILARLGLSDPYAGQDDE